MINQPNQVYVVENDFDLDEDTVVLPKGCYLDFKGGTLRNGVLRGMLTNEYIRPEWFGAKGDGITDDFAAIQIAMGIGRNIVFTGIYCVSQPIIVSNQGITIEKGAIIRAIGDSIDYVFKYLKSKQPIYMDGDGTIDCNGKCGGIYYDTPETFRLQNLYINRVAYKPVLRVKRGFIESYNVNCDGRGVDKQKQPLYNVQLDGGSDHKFDRWTIITQTTGIQGCAGSSIFSRVHLWGRLDCGFVVTGKCTFNMCYTDYCKIGFDVVNSSKRNSIGINIFNHNTIGNKEDILVYSHYPTLIGTLTLATHLNSKMKLVAFSDDIKKGVCGLTINTASIAGMKGPTSLRPNFSQSPNNDILVGYQYYDTTLKRLVWWNGQTWDSYPSYKKGNSSQRPKVQEGELFYDSTLKKVILYNGTQWVNLDGTILK